MRAPARGVAGAEMRMTEPAGVKQGATVHGAAYPSACPPTGPDGEASPAGRRPRARGWPPTFKADLRDTLLQWSTGLLATMLGAQMVIVPHQLSTQAYDLVRPHIGLWGGAMLLAGILMLVVAATGRSRWLVLSAHLGLGALLLLLGLVLAATGGWYGGTIFAML